MSNPNVHLRSAPHYKHPIDEEPAPFQVDSSQSCVSPEVFRQKLLRMIAVLHLPFSVVESDEFRDLMLYSSPALRGNDTLPKSGTTIKTWMLELFLLSQAILITLLY